MVYLHIPFCKSFCTYCDFYSEICSGKESAEEQNLFASEVCDEIDARIDELLAAEKPRTLYVGGGTPSVLDVEVLGRIVSHLKQVTGRDGFDEFTVEVNPEDIRHPDYVRALMRMGVNRISMGVQSFDDGILRWMNRRHDAARAVQAFDILREAGMHNISIDLISGLSQLDDTTWMETVSKAVSLHPEHISTYQLSIEEGSALARMVSEGKYHEASESQCRRQYDILCQLLSAAGYVHYEISNFALPGYEALHNSAYWKRVPYVGLGPGAHSFDGVRRRWNSESVTGYAPEFEILTQEDVRVESIMLPLRTADGMSLKDAERLCRTEDVMRLVAEGALVCKDGRIRIPENHFFVSDDIIRSLI